MGNRAGLGGVAGGGHSVSPIPTGQLGADSFKDSCTFKAFTSQVKGRDPKGAPWFSWYSTLQPQAGPGRAVLHARPGVFLASPLTAGRCEPDCPQLTPASIEEMGQKLKRFPSPGPGGKEDALQ